MKFLQRKHLVSILLLIIGQLVFNLAWADDNSAAARAKRVADLKQKIESIQYGAKKPKAVVYVFTDMNCTFCRKLHHEFPKLAEQGIQVRVLAMPRQGIDSPGYKEWVSIWCSNDQNDSLDRAMEGEDIAVKTCKNPIKMHYTLGRKWGVIGTPSVLFADGTLKAGYFSAEKLAKEAIKRSAGVDEENAKANDATDDKATAAKGNEKAGDKTDKAGKTDKANKADKNSKDKDHKAKDELNAKDKNQDKSKDKAGDKAIDKDKAKGTDKAKTDEKTIVKSKDSKESNESKGPDVKAKDDKTKDSQSKN